jgi:hypothetical protein
MRYRIDQDEGLCRTLVQPWCPTRSTPQVRSELPMHVAPVEREEGGGEGVVAVLGKQLVLDAEEVVLAGQAALVHDGGDALGHWIDVFGLAHQAATLPARRLNQATRRQHRAGGSPPGEARCGPCNPSGPHAVSLARLQCRTIDPLSVPELTPVAWVAVLCSVKAPVVAAKRPLPPVMV